MLHQGRLLVNRLLGANSTWIKRKGCFITLQAMVITTIRIRRLLDGTVPSTNLLLDGTLKKLKIQKYSRPLKAHLSAAPLSYCCWAGNQGKKFQKKHKLHTFSFSLLLVMLGNYEPTCGCSSIS